MEEKDRKKEDIEKLVEVYGVGADFKEVMEYIKVDGAYDLRKLQELEGRYGYNGGKPCDVLRGPCSCGGWH